MFHRQRRHPCSIRQNEQPSAAWSNVCLVLAYPLGQNASLLQDLYWGNIDGIFIKDLPKPIHSPVPHHCNSAGVNQLTCSKCRLLGLLPSQKEPHQAPLRRGAVKLKQAVTNVETNQTGFYKYLIIVFGFWQARDQQHGRRLFHQSWNVAGIKFLSSADFLILNCRPYCHISLGVNHFTLVYPFITSRVERAEIQIERVKRIFVPRQYNRPPSLKKSSRRSCFNCLAQNNRNPAPMSTQ